MDDLLIPVKSMIFCALIMCKEEFYAHVIHGKVEDPRGKIMT